LSIYTESGNTSTLSVADDAPIVTVEQDFYLLIPSRFPPIELYARIANDEGHAAGIADIEAITNPRLREKARILGAADCETQDPTYQNWNHAPFTYPNPDGTRFFSAATPALELFDELQTALAVSVNKRERFLASTDQGAMGLDMRVLTRRVKGRFADCRAWGAGLERSDRWGRARQFLDVGVDGLLFRPDERPTATGIAVLSGIPLGRAMQGDHFRFAWDGERIRALYAFRDGSVVLPEALGTTAKVFAV